MFFEDAFGAEIAVEGLPEGDRPWSGPDVETAFGLPQGAMVRARRVPGDGWLYGRTPWGTVIEMVTFQEGRQA